MLYMRIQNHQTHFIYTSANPTTKQSICRLWWVDLL